MKATKTNEASRNLTLLNEYGLCGRPAAMIVKTVCRYLPQTTVRVTCRDHTVSGASIMGLMTLEASCGAIVTVQATGPEARAVIEALTLLFNDGFHSGETCLPIPKAHSEFLEDPPKKPTRRLRLAFFLGPQWAVERKHLVRAILPQLRIQCRQQDVRLIVTDLRRGQAPVSGPALAEALDKLTDDSHVFLILSGEQAAGLLALDRIPDKIADMRRFMESLRKGRSDSAELIHTLLRCYPWNKRAGAYLRRADISEADTAVIRPIFSRLTDRRRTQSVVVVNKEGHGTKAPASLKPRRVALGLNIVNCATLAAFEQGLSDVMRRWLKAEIESLGRPA